PAPPTPPPDRFDELSQQLAQFQAQFTATMAAVSHRVETLERRSPDSAYGSGMNPPLFAVPIPPAPQPPRLKL
ncbi:hypothetical protein A2U01_0105148, partial [Trifolium medium]|nr:hypothetical protein [Trifolium medium]